MTVIAGVPDSYVAERTYILTVLLEDLIGLPVQVHVDSRAERVVLTCRGVDGRIEFDDGLFSLPEADWLTASSVEALTTTWLATASLPFSTTLRHPALPFPAFDTAGPIGVEVLPDRCRVKVDLLGSAFFHLTRYEEVARPVADQHGRFPSHASWAHRTGVLGRPVVDEYGELIWSIIERTWPQLRRRSPTYSVYSTHDVDHPFEHVYRSAMQLAKQAGALAVRKTDPAAAARTARAWLRVRREGASADPFATFGDIMAIAEANGARSAFFFIVDPSEVGRTPETFYRLDDEPIEALLRSIADGGHEIGLHASYVSFRDEAQLRREFSALTAAAARLSITQERWGGRHHYLRWDAETGYPSWTGAGLDFDSSVGYPEEPGFRAGTCFAHKTFDLRGRRRLELVERPLALMDTTLLSPRYLGVMPASPEAYRHVDAIRDECLHHGGELVTLWHNNLLADRAVRELFEHAVRRSN